ncbi:hypothetical protein F4821DRAFT_222374 [Hypoxylon rubiginosum]|uniref:Uncharacterized protein n=1 Tax=Hypoxylon rubiginosum TaxID=110542 RepID=A0ACC0DK94_9PEZI|nr:hypothetical protein F4821DRAFT_222374 [Hypoxylon rubiginosum]
MGTASFTTKDLIPPSISLVSTIATLDPYVPRPVTVQLWSTIFNPGLALKHHNFTVQDISQDPPTDINLDITKGPKRPGFQCKKGT